MATLAMVAGGQLVEAAHRNQVAALHVLCLIAGLWAGAAGGLVFVAGTQDEKLRAFDAESGRELWEAKLPFAGTSAPAVYAVDGKQFVVVTATGGGRVGGKSGAGDAYVAFCLP